MNCYEGRRSTTNFRKDAHAYFFQNVRPKMSALRCRTGIVILPDDIVMTTNAIVQGIGE